MLTKKKCERVFTLYKRYAMKAFLKRNYSKALECMSYACRTACYCNFKFSDIELEALVIQISGLLIKRKTFTPQCGKFVFYDNFNLNDRVLARQYINALLSMSSKLLVISSGDKDNISVYINDILQQNSKIEFLFLNKQLPIVDKIMQISCRVASFAPEKAFIHTTPYDVVGATVWGAFTEVERYQINVTDQTFWLGINCMDYVIEYRNYGYNLSSKYRGIDYSRLLTLLYYPVTNDISFLGLPRGEESGMIRLLSGGDFYKILGDNNAFLNMIVGVLENDKNTLFYFAGSGQQWKLKRFIAKKHLENRWFLLGNRPDITAVVRHVDIYIGTYPIAGGLMTQIAASCQKPVIAYYPHYDSWNNLDELFCGDTGLPKMMFEDIDEFNHAIHELIRNPEKRVTDGKMLCRALQTQSSFAADLKRIVETKENSTAIPDISIDTNRFCELYLNAENHYLHTFPACLINSILAKRRPDLFMIAGIEFIIHYNKSKLYRKIEVKIADVFRK